jgi:ubiquinone/menaquinone biosynthesis C-methylase UbiE
MRESTLRTLSLLAQSVGWYLRKPDNQYRGQPLTVYDKAAAELAKREEFAEFLISGMEKSSGSVLEIAAGSGLVSSVLQARLPDVTFLDLSLQALKILKARILEDENPTKVVNATFLSLPFPDSGFNSIVCVGGYRYVGVSKNEFWGEMIRVLRPGGKLFFAQFKPRGFPMSGTALEDDLSSYGLQLVKVKDFHPHLEFGPFRVAMGGYELVEYFLSPEHNRFITPPGCTDPPGEQ